MRSPRTFIPRVTRPGRRLALAAVLCYVVMHAAAHGPTPQRVEESIDIAAPPAAVWALVGDFGRFAPWHPLLTASSSDKGNSVGATRTLTLARGGMLTEDLDEYLPAEMLINYRSGRVIDPTVLAVGSYSARLRVSATAGGSRLEWRARAYRADTGNEPAASRDDAAAVTALQEFIRPALAAAKRQLEAR